MNNNDVEIPVFYKSEKKEYSKQIKLFNAGWVTFYDYYGDDITPLISARMSTGNPSGVDPKKDAGSRSFLWRHGHVSPFEQCGLSVIFQVPITAARQILRHKSLHVNEYSQRYSEPIFEYFIPEHENICYDNDFNKQSSGEPVSKEISDMFINDAKSAVVLNDARYRKYRDLGVAKERIRDFQPVSAYTRIMATANLRDWLFFLNKRLKPDAQVEIRQFSEAVYSMLQDLFPLCCEVFEEYTLNSESLSKTELIVLSHWFDKLQSGISDEDSFDVVCAENNLNKSRTREMKKKLGLFKNEL